MVGSIFVIALLAPPIDLTKLPTAARKPVSNYYQKYEMQPVCSESEIARVQGETSKLAKLNNAKQAWSLAFTIFCGNSKASKNYIRRHTPKRILVTEYPGKSDNDVSQVLEHRESFPMLMGSAWEARVESVSNNKLLYSYNAGGVCSGGFELRYVKGNWLVVKSTEACD